MVYDDADLVKRTLKGERDAFDSLVRKYQDAVYGLAFCLIGNFSDAQDVAQETFIKAYLRLSQLKDKGKFAHWLNKITVNECVSWLRRRQSISRLYEQMDISRNPIPTPEQECEAKELNDAVRRAVESLSEKNRLAVTLYYIDGLSQREVGNFLGISTDAVANRISRARKQLKGKMMKMIEATLKENKLPDDFINQVRESLNQAQTANVRGRFNEALAYLDKALNTLENLPQSPEARKLRKEALWLKGDALKAAGTGEEYLKYYEQVTKLEEKESDKRGYAESLLNLSHKYSEKEKAAECGQKALRIYEELGDLGGQAEVFLWTGTRSILTEPGKALENFHKALNLYSRIKEKHMGYESVCRAAIAALEEIGNAKLIVCMVTSEVLKKTPKRLAYIGQPGFTRGECRERDKMEGPFVDDMHHVVIISPLQERGTILDYGLRVGDSQVIEHHSFTSKPLIAKRIIQSDSEEVKVAAGNFPNCLKIKTVITHDPDEEGYDRYKKINQRQCGTKQVWFAPGVGPVKFIFDRVDGRHFETELADYSVADDGNDYFPLSVGNRWGYRWIYDWALDERYIFKDCYEVGARKGNVYYIDHYGCAYFSGSREEYDALQQETAPD